VPPLNISFFSHFVATELRRSWEILEAELQLGGGGGVGRGEGFDTPLKQEYYCGVLLKPHHSMTPAFMGYRIPHMPAETFNEILSNETPISWIS
jgi:hypothetical protein